MFKPGLLFCLALLAALPARAEPNEPLVMRLIFEDCLGYVRHGRAPFQGLPTRPASAEAREDLNRSIPNRQDAVELLSPRYVAVWGETPDGRHCMVRTVWWADRDGLPALLGVPVKGFVQRVNKRAVAEGLGEVGLAEEFSPLSTSAWSEPETGHDRGPRRPVSFSIMATGPADAQGIADAGLMVMGGPPRNRD